MAERTSPEHDTGTTPAGPPADGRQDHMAMRAAAMLPLSGDTGITGRAAGGGLEIPGQAPDLAAGQARELSKVSPRPEPIPGAYERDTLTSREPGAMGGRFNGADAKTAGDAERGIEPVTGREHTREGGGPAHEG